MRYNGSNLFRDVVSFVLGVALVWWTVVTPDPQLLASLSGGWLVGGGIGRVIVAILQARWAREDADQP